MIPRQSAIGSTGQLLHAAPRFTCRRKTHAAVTRRSNSRTLAWQRSFSGILLKELKRLVINCLQAGGRSFDLDRHWPPRHILMVSGNRTPCYRLPSQRVTKGSKTAETKRSLQGYATVFVLRVAQRLSRRYGFFCFMLIHVCIEAGPASGPHKAVRKRSVDEGKIDSLEWLEFFIFSCLAVTVAG